MDTTPLTIQSVTQDSNEIKTNESVTQDPQVSDDTTVKTNETNDTKVKTKKRDETKKSKV